MSKHYLILAGLLVGAGLFYYFGMETGALATLAAGGLFELAFWYTLIAGADED